MGVAPRSPCPQTRASPRISNGSGYSRNMITLACGHEGTPADSRLCVHLRTRREGSIRYVQWFLGSGLDADFLCEPCVELRTAGEAVIVDPICKECHDFAATKVGALVGIRGKPGVLTRAEPFRTELRESTFPQQLGAIEAMASIDGE